MLYTAEMSMGFLEVRGWDLFTGHTTTLTEVGHSLPIEILFGLPVAMAAGPGGVIYAAGYPYSFSRSVPTETGIVRLHENQFTPWEKLTPWIDYGSGGSQAASDLAVGPSGDLFLSDLNLGILRFNGNTGAYEGLTVPISPDGLRSPKSVAFGPDGLLYVLDSGDSIHVYDPATGTRIRTPVSTESGLLSAALSMDAAPDGDLYILSSGGHSLVRLDPVSGNVLLTKDLSSFPMEPGSVLPGSTFSPSIVYFQVPEPPAICLWALGAGIVGLLGRRHSQRPMGRRD